MRPGVSVSAPAMNDNTSISCPACGGGPPLPLCRALLYAGREREICRCRDCGSAYYFPVPEPEEIARCYQPGYFRGFFKQYWKDYYKGRALASRLSGWRREGELLDVGCALGTLLAGVRDHSGWRVQGLEFSADAALMGERLNDVSIAASSLSTAPFREGRFDYVHVNNVLEHEPDPAAALRTVSNILKAGGRVELTVPNGPVDLMPNVTLYRRLGCGVKTRHGGHLYFFTRRALEVMLDAAGLRVLSFRNFHFKQGLKARGWLPGAYRTFLRSVQPEQRDEGGKLSLEEYRKLIPKAPCWRAYYAGYAIRRFFYAPGTCFGADFKILAEKRAFRGT